MPPDVYDLVCDEASYFRSSLKTELELDVAST